VKKYLCKNCGWFIVQTVDGEWIDSMKNKSCIAEGIPHQPTGKGVEINEKLRVY